MFALLAALPFRFMIRDGHRKDECLFKAHPDFNDTTAKWGDSDTGKALKRAGQDKIRWSNCLPLL